MYVIFNRQNMLEDSKERMKACLKEIFGEQ